MKVAVMGAGAVGSYLGAQARLAGHEVVLVGRREHVDAVNARGLRISRGEQEETVTLHASTDPATVHDADLVLVCVKSTGTAEAAADLAPHLPDGAVVLSVQNGIGNAEILAGALPAAAVAASVIYVAVGLDGPGHVRHHGADELVLGDGPAAPLAECAFAGTRFTVRRVPDVRVALWTKLVVNCAWNPLSALTGCSYGRIAELPGMSRVIADVATECVAVARAEGVPLTDAVADVDVPALARMMPTQRSSTYADLVRGRPTEIDFLTGEVARRGESLGVATPACRLLTALVHAAETSGAARSAG